MAGQSGRLDQIREMHRRPSTLDEAILFPGTVKINVQGAFIVGEEETNASGTSSPSEDGVQRDTRDIRLPNHKAVVSHVALDVRPT